MTNNKQQTAVTPQEKAKDLIRQFYSVGAMECKQCALIAVNEILSNGHAWADDHIATSSDDIEEVKNFLVNELSGGNTDLIQEEPAQ
jgi:hypothetical protein